MASKQRRCKDCGTEDIILKVTPPKYDLHDIAVELCSTCLHSRAQLQRAKEDKLSFPKLLAKIRSETRKRISDEIASASGIERLSWGSYKGVSGWDKVATQQLSQYWIEQLKQKEQSNDKTTCT